MFKNKKAMILDWGAFAQGLIVGIIVGAVVVYLGTKGIIPIPFL